jgi:hypothetical protein
MPLDAMPGSHPHGSRRNQGAEQLEPPVLKSTAMRQIESDFETPSRSMMWPVGLRDRRSMSFLRHLLSEKRNVCYSAKNQNKKLILWAILPSNGVICAILSLTRRCGHSLHS